MKTKKRGYCKKYYLDSWRYLKESSNYVWAVFVLFVVFGLAGFFLPVPELLANNIQEFIEGLIDMIKDLNIWQTILFIFKNNVLSSFVALFFGVILGIIPVLAAISNGYVLGFVSSIVVGEVGYLSLWRLLPHGIFEIPAIIISLGLGIKFGMFIFAKNPREEFMRRLILGLKVFLSIILPLLVIAAVIEGLLIGLV